jgi:hypothetical protein
MKIKEITQKEDSIKEISKRLDNAKKLNYKNLQKEIKNTFEAFKKDPKKFGVDDVKYASKIQDANFIVEKYLWKQFNKAFIIKLKSLSHDEAADAFLIDFEQDDEHQLTTIKQLKAIIKDPSNKKYDLEDDMINYIKSKDFDEDAFIKSVIKKDDDLEEKNDLKEFGLKMLKYLQGIWLKIAPSIDKIFDKLIDLGSDALKIVLKPHLDGNQKLIVEKTIDKLGENLEKVDEKITKLAKSENTDDLLKKTKEVVKETVEEIVKDVTDLGTVGVEILTNIITKKEDEDKDNVEITGGANDTGDA